MLGFFSAIGNRGDTLIPGGGKGGYDFLTIAVRGGLNGNPIAGVIVHYLAVPDRILDSGDSVRPVTGQKAINRLIDLCVIKAGYNRATIADSSIGYRLDATYSLVCRNRYGLRPGISHASDILRDIL